MRYNNELSMVEYKKYNDNTINITCSLAGIKNNPDQSSLCITRPMEGSSLT